MQHNNTLTTHELADILLRCDNIPVVIPSLGSLNHANFIQNATLYQNINSPFEYCLLLSPENTLIPNDELEIPD